MTALVKSVAEWNRVAAGIRREEVVGFVPTMGALHQGHGALLEEARSRCSVVWSLFPMVKPIFAFFGEKDYQQLTLVGRLGGDLNMPIQVVGVATARESDGLALSSRNRRLNLRERAFAPLLYKALLGAQRSIAHGERNVVAIKEHAQRVLHGVPDIKIDYFDLVDPETIRPV